MYAYAQTFWDISVMKRGAQPIFQVALILASRSQQQRDLHFLNRTVNVIYLNKRWQSPLRSKSCVNGCV